MFDFPLQPLRFGKPSLPIFQGPREGGAVRREHEDNSQRWAIPDHEGAGESMTCPRDAAEDFRNTSSPSTYLESVNNARHVPGAKTVVNVHHSDVGGASIQHS